MMLIDSPNPIELQRRYLISELGVLKEIIAQIYELKKALEHDKYLKKYLGTL